MLRTLDADRKEGSRPTRASDSDPAEPFALTWQTFDFDTDPSKLPVLVVVTAAVGWRARTS